MDQIEARFDLNNQTKIHINKLAWVYIKASQDPV